MRPTWCRYVLNSWVLDCSSSFLLHDIHDTLQNTAKKKRSGKSSEDFCSPTECTCFCTFLMCTSTVFFFLEFRWVFFCLFVFVSSSYCYFSATHIILSSIELFSSLFFRFSSSSAAHRIHIFPTPCFYLFWFAFAFFFFFVLFFSSWAFTLRSVSRRASGQLLQSCFTLQFYYERASAFFYLSFFSLFVSLFFFLSH